MAPASAAPPAEEIQELAHLPLGPALQPPGLQQGPGPIQGRAALGNGGLDVGQGRGSHAPAGAADGPAEAHHVEGIGEEPQVGQQILHLLTLVELRAPHQLVGHIEGPQRLFQLPGLPIGPVEHGHLGVRKEDPLLPDPVHHPFGLQAPLVQELEGQVFPFPQARPEGLAQTLTVVGDDRARRVQDPLGGAVVLLQLDLGGLGEVPLEVQDVADIGPSPSVDRLVFVPHDAEIVVLPGQMLHQQILGAVGVLVFVHQQILESLRVDGLDARLPEEPLRVQ